MRLTYLFHSGFVVESEHALLVFDYWMDPKGVMDSVLQSDKPLYVFSSHFHEDHFSRDIFDWRTRRPNVTYLLSKDILRHRRADREEADVWLAKGGTWSNDLLSVHALGSTDSGVSWVVEVEGKRLFHAGDLNNWYARFLSDITPGEIIHSMEMGEDIDPIAHQKQFLGELKDIRKVSDHFDVAFFPVDGRIGNGYTLGGRQFIDRFQVGLFVPMHFVASGFESAWRFKEFADTKGIPLWCIQREGESFEID